MTESVAVGYQGRPGAFSEEALIAAAGGSVSPCGFRTVREVGDALVAGTLPFGFLPLENSIAGSVAPTYHVLYDDRLRIVGEVIMPIRQCLLGHPGATVTTIRHALSHPVALAQCSDFFEAHPALVPSTVSDTAGAAEQIAAGTDTSLAAIASYSCAERYGLSLLAEGIQDTSDNQTRFVLITTEQGGDGPPLFQGRPDHLMVEATLPHEPGAVAAMLRVIAEQGHNVTRIESQPTRTPWSYRFFIEIEVVGPVGPGTAWQESVLQASGACTFRIAGHYPRVSVDGPLDRASPSKGNPQQVT